MSLIQDQSSSRSSSSSLSSSNNKHTIHVQRLRLTKITRLEPADIYNCYFRGCSQYQDTKETALLWSCLCGAASITARWIDHDRIVHYMEGSSNVHLQLNNKDVPEKYQQLFRRQMVQKCKLADFFLFLLQDTSDPKARTIVAQNILMYYCKPHPTPGLTNGHDFIRKIIQPNDLEAIKNKCNEIIDSFNSSMIPRVRRSRAKSVCIEPTASSASLSLLTSPPPPLSSSASDDTGRLNRRKSSAKRSFDLSDPTLSLSLSSSSFVTPSPAAKRRNSIGMEEDESVMTLFSAIIKHMDVFYIPLSALWQFLKAKYLLTNKENIKQNRFKKDIAEMLPTMLWTDFERQDRNCIQALTKFVDIEKVENVLTINSITRFISVKQNTLKDETNAQDRKLNIKALYLFLNYCSQHELFFVPMDDGKSDTGSISLLEDMMESSTWITTLFNKLGSTFHKMWIDDDDRQLLTYFNLKPLNIRPKNILASMYKNDTLTIQYIFALLKNHIMGQDAGLDIVARALYSVLMSLDPSSADSSFNILLPMMLLFTGLPGTGKTTLMKEIGRLFGVENTPAFVFISGDTHTSEADVTQITGAPPGLVGYDGVGTFVHKVKKLVEYAEQVRNVVPVIAIDELQSFHPKVLTVLRSLFAEGVIYSSKNEKITLPAGSIILIGGNLGKDKYLEALNNGINVTNEQLIRWATQEIISLFGDQLYSRIRTIIPFKVADEDALKNIILQTITTEIGAIRNHIQVTVEDDVIEQLIRIHEYRSGIRKLNHVIREMVRLHLFVLSRKIIDQLTNVVIKIVNIENEEDGGSKVMIGLVEPSNTNRIISSYELVISSKKDAMDDAGDNELGSIISSDDMEIESKTQSSPIPSTSLKHPTSPPRVKIPSSSSSASLTRSRMKSLVSLSHPYDYQYSMNSPLSSSSSSLFSNDPYTTTMTNNNGLFRLSPLMSDDMQLSDLSLPPLLTSSEGLTISS